MNDKRRTSSVRIGSCNFDAARAELCGHDGKPIHLRPQAMRLLELLLTRAGSVVTRDELIAALWPGVVVTDDSLVQCVGDVRRALGPDHRLLRTVPRLGYRLDVAPLAEPDPGTDRRPRGAVVWAGLALFLAALAWLMIGHGNAPIAEALRAGHGAAVSSDSSTIVVRFRDGEAPAATKEPGATLAAGIADQLVADLVRNADLKVAPAPALSGDAPVGDLVRGLPAQLVVDGRVQLGTTGPLLTVALIEASSARVLWVDRRESTVERLAIDREALLRRIAQEAHASVPHDGRDLVLPLPPHSLEAYLLVTRALARVYRFDRDEYRIARDELAQALQRDPGYALAWAVHAALDAVDATAGITGDLADERGGDLVARADRAVALDPRLALAQHARSLALVSAGRRAEALKAAEDAVSLAPFDPQSHLVLANALAANARMAEAMRAIDQARSRYGAAPVVFDFVDAKVLWGNDRFDEAVSVASRCLQRAPHFVACRAVRALASDGMGRLEAAREDLKAYRVTVPGSPAHAFGPGSYGVPKLMNEWLADIRREVGLP